MAAAGSTVLSPRGSTTIPNNAMSDHRRIPLRPKSAPRCRECAERTSPLRPNKVLRRRVAKARAWSCTLQEREEPTVINQRQPPLKRSSPHQHEIPAEQGRPKEQRSDWPLVDEETVKFPIVACSPIPDSPPAEEFDIPERGRRRTRSFPDNWPISRAKQSRQKDCSEAIGGVTPSTMQRSGVPELKLGLSGSLPSLMPEQEGDSFQYWRKVYGLGMSGSLDLKPSGAYRQHLSRLSPVSEKDSISLSPSRALRRKSHDRALRSSFFESESSWIRGQPDLLTWFDDTSSSDSAEGDIFSSCGEEPLEADMEEDMDGFWSSDDESAEKSVVEIATPVVRTKAVLRDIPSRSSHAHSRGSSDVSSAGSRMQSPEEKHLRFEEPVSPPTTPEQDCAPASTGLQSSFHKASAVAQARVPRRRIRKKSITRLPSPQRVGPVQDASTFDGDMTGILCHLERSVQSFPASALTLDSSTISRIRYAATREDAAIEDVSGPQKPSATGIHRHFSLRRRNTKSERTSKAESGREKSTSGSLILSPLQALTPARETLGSVLPGKQAAPTPLKALFPVWAPYDSVGSLHATLIGLNYVDTAIARSPSPKALAVLGISMQDPHPPDLTTPKRGSTNQSQSHDPAVHTTTILRRLSVLRESLNDCALQILRTALGMTSTVTPTMESGLDSLDHTQAIDLESGFNLGPHEQNLTGTTYEAGKTEQWLLIRVLAAFVKLIEDKEAEKNAGGG